MIQIASFDEISPLFAGPYRDHNLLASIKMKNTIYFEVKK